jgi:hypothetical protein
MNKRNKISIIISAIALAFSVYYYAYPAELAIEPQLASDGIVIVKGMLLIFSLSLAIYISRLFYKE